jgi:hypothetical protein
MSAPGALPATTRKSAEGLAQHLGEGAVPRATMEAGRRMPSLMCASRGRKWPDTDLRRSGPEPSDPGGPGSRSEQSKALLLNRIAMG